MIKSSWKTSKSVFGYHLALDLYSCNPKTVQSIEKCYYFLTIMPRLIKTNIQSPPFIFHKKGLGFAGWIPVVESGISLYAYFPMNFVAVDIYACKKFSHEKIKKFVVDCFRPKKIKARAFLRGEKYKPPLELLKIRGSIK